MRSVDGGEKREKSIRLLESLFFRLEAHLLFMNLIPVAGRLALKFYNVHEDIRCEKHFRSFELE